MPVRRTPPLDPSSGYRLFSILDIGAVTAGTSRRVTVIRTIAIPAPKKTTARFSEVRTQTTALELLREVLTHGTNLNRRYCVYCKTKMIAPLELHHKDCVWRRAWELVNQK